ncbi:MAG: hypothetical protein ABIQ93_13950 [Saprospiraceae bacterium]
MTKLQVSILCCLPLLFPACQPDAPALRPYYAPLIVLLDDRSGTVKKAGITLPDTAFYADLGRDLQTHCPGSMLAVVLCGNPLPESKASIRLEADTTRLLPADHADNNIDRFNDRIYNEKTLAGRKTRLDNWLTRLDQQVIHYQAGPGGDVTYLDDALLRSRRILDAPVHTERPKLVILLTDGVNENAGGRPMPFARPFASADDDFEILLVTWENPDQSCFGGAKVQNLESLPDLKLRVRAFLAEHALPNK